MHHLYPIYATKTIDDGKYNDYENLEGYTFPGYIANEKRWPLIPLNVGTHPCPQDTRGPDGNAIETLWCMCDGPEQFLKNSVKLGHSWHYIKKQVRYRLNENGYRAPEWSNIEWKDAVVIIGCSMTFGIGVAEDETINYYLQELLGRPVINIGYPAGSNETLFNNSVAINQTFDNPAAVVMAWSTWDRFKFYSSYFSDIGLWTEDESVIDGVNLKRLYDDLNLNQTNQSIRSYYLEKANKALWKNRSEYYTFSFFESTAHYMRLDAHFKTVPGARDLVHPCRYQNLKIANHLYEVLKNRGL